MQKFIKNIDYKTVVKLADLVPIQPGQIGQQDPGPKQGRQCDPLRL